MSKVFIAYGNNEFSIVQEIEKDESATYRTLEGGIKSQFLAEKKLKEYENNATTK